MIRMTFDEYDEIIEKLENIEKEDIKKNYPSIKEDVYYPSIKEIKQYIETNFENSFYYLIWLSEFNKPEKEEDKETYKYIKKILRENIELY